VKPDIERVQALADISRSALYASRYVFFAYVVTATKPAKRL